MKKYVLGIFCSIFMFVSCMNNTDEIGKNKVFRENDKYYILYEGNLFELPKDVKLTSNKTIEQYFTDGLIQKLNIEVINKTSLLNDLNKYFDNGIQYVSKSEVVTNPVKIPLLTTSNGVYIDSLRFEQLMKSVNANTYMADNTENNDITNQNAITTVNVEESLSGKHIEILNANNINGFAREIGNKLSERYGVSYNAENYSQKEIYNYIIKRNMTDEEILAILDVAGLKYVKILEDTDVKPEANFVLITGSDDENDFEIEIVSNISDSIYNSKLNGYNVVNNGIVESYNNEDISKLTKGKIYYNQSDKYTALILLKKLGENNFDLIENSELSNKIVLILNK